MILDLRYPEKSAIKYQIHQFPDGHNHIELLGGFNKYQEIDVICRIRNADELFTLLQVKDICDNCSMQIDQLKITYLFTARCDRQFSLGQGFDLRIIGNLLRNIAKNIIIVDLHSDVLANYLNYKNEFVIDKFPEYKKHRICFPDDGARLRYLSTDRRLMPIYQYCEKTKPYILKKERIGNEIKLEFLEKPKKNKLPIMLIDDLCDGGGTFKQAAKLLVTEDQPITLFVTHAIQSKALIDLCKIYDEVIITDSYIDYNEIIKLNISNLKVINI